VRGFVSKPFDVGEMVRLVDDTWRRHVCQTFV
jgi:hypothetical protein